MKLKVMDYVSLFCNGKRI